MPRSSRRWRLVEDEAAAALYARCAALHHEAAAAERRLRALLERLRALREARLAAGGTRKASFAAAADPPSMDVQPLEQCAELLQSVVDGYRELAAAPTSDAAAKAAAGAEGGAGTAAAAAAAGASEGGSSVDASASSESRTSGRRGAAGPGAGPGASGPALSATIFRFKTAHWLRTLRRSRLALTVLAGHAAAAVLAQCARAAEHNGCQAALAVALRLASLHNALVALGAKDGLRVAVACRNTCPALLRPLRRLSLTRLLQLAAAARAEAATRALVSALLHGFHGVRCPERGPLDAAAPSPDRAADDSSSVEVYRALTRHLTPPCATVLPPVEGTGAPGTAPVAKGAVSRLDPAVLPRLVRVEEEQVSALLGVAARACPELLGPGALTTSRRTGQAKATRAARERVRAFYAAALWAAVGARAEHELLWWGAAPLGPATPDAAAQLRRWLHQLLVAGAVPLAVAPAVETLQDALCCHVTATSWDALFRLTLVHGRPSQPLRPSTAHDSVQGGTEAGRLFAEVLRSLVALSNACEGTAAWAAGAPLAELPLVEQIPVLHRLDHSVHTARLWATAAARAQVAAWRVSSFALVSQWDVGACVAALGQLRLADHRDLRTAGSEHVVVCARMRAKLVSEVRENVDKLKKVPEECLACMAAVCRTVSLANLHMVFPEPTYYRQTREMPSFASSYVEQYLERVLRPVLLAVATLPQAVQETICGMTVRIMCEAWLDHIYMHRIKFTEWGALQLLADFGAVAQWLAERAAVAPDLRRALAASEALRRCEGVGRLLLRRRGERIPMTVPPPPAPAATAANAAPAPHRHAKHRRSRRGRPSPPPESPSPPAEDPAMPAEMYVPNQEQWLELRTTRGRRLCSASLCCS